MSYKGIVDLYNDLNASVSNVSGLNDFYMLDESEVNRLRNITYPVCISSIPNSSVSDINRAYEEYSMTLLILKNEKKSNTDAASLKIYDECIDLFTKLTDEIMFQRGGRLIVEKDSLEIERVSRLGNDLATGLRLRFILLAPSQIAFPESEITLDNSSNLLGFYTTSKGIDVTATSNSAIWSIRQGSMSSLNNAIINSSPAFTNNKFVFAEPNDSPNAETLSTPVNFSSANFTVIMSVYIDDNPPYDEDRTLFSIDDGLVYNGFPKGNEFSLIIDGSGGANEGSIITKTRTSAGGLTTTGYTNSDTQPYGTSSTVKNIALVNDDSNNLVSIYKEIGVNNDLDVRTSSYAVQHEVMSNCFLRIGGRFNGILNNENVFTDGFEGHVKNVVVYDAALSQSTIAEVFEELNKLP